MKQSRLTDIGDRFVIAKVDGGGEVAGFVVNRCKLLHG